MFASEVLKLLSEQKNLEKLEIAAVKWCTNNSWRKIALKTAHAYIHALLLGYYMKRSEVNLKR
jgi:hypothetical protein